MAYEVVKSYISNSLHPLKATYTMKPEYITVHNTANDASADNEIAYMKRNPAATSYHVAIDDTKVIEAIPFDRNAWHCGDGQGRGNRSSIGIEICYSKSGGVKYTVAEENTVQYIASLLKRFGWGIDRVKWHRDWSGKNCPHRIIDEGRLDIFKKRIVIAMTDIKEEGVRMFNPTNGTLKNAYKQFLQDAIKDGHLTKQWLDDYNADKLSLDDALALKVIVDQRRK